jgi:hypothetical protein
MLGHYGGQWSMVDGQRAQHGADETSRHEYLGTYQSEVH